MYQEIHGEMQASRIISLLLAAALLVAAGFALKITFDDNAFENIKDCKNQLRSTSRFLLPFSITLIVLAVVFGGATLWESRSDSYGY